jgi:gluconokinase
MSEKFPRSPYDATKGLVYFLRMLDKIRLHEKNVLPQIYVKHLGTDFDGRCLRFLGVKYDDVKRLVLAGEKDEAVLDWCLKNGRKPTEEEIETWSGFMMKRGWRDEASDRIIFRLKESGIEHRDKDAVTMFDFIDIDENRTPPDFKKWEPPRFVLPD